MQSLGDNKTKNKAQNQTINQAVDMTTTELEPDLHRQHGRERTRRAGGLGRRLTRQMQGNLEFYSGTWVPTSRQDSEDRNS